MATLVLKNNTASPVTISDVGYVLPGSGSDTFTNPEHIRVLAVSEHLRTLIAATDVTVNDGMSDLSPAAAVVYLEKLWSRGGWDDAIDIPDLTGVISDAQHGSRGGGSLHALATTLVSGFMSDTDKVKLDGIAAGAGLSLTGNIVWVDAVNGNDGTGVRGDAGKPFLTVAAALAAALAGDLVFIRPGTYNLAAGISVPSGVSIRGACMGHTVVQMLGVVANTTLVTLNSDSRIEDLTLKLTSAGHFTLTGILWTGTSTASCVVRGIEVLVDNSGASPVGSSDVTAMLVQSTGFPKEDFVNVRVSRVLVNSAGLGNKRGILLNTAVADFHISDCATRCDNTGGGAGSYIGVETNFANGEVDYIGGLIFGWSADVSQTLGVLRLGAADLQTANANGKNFTTLGLDSLLIWGDSGGLPANSTRYFRPGTASVALSEIQIKTPRKAVLKNLFLRAAAGPGAARVDTFTLRKNGVNTPLAVTLTGAQATADNVADSVSFQPGDLISMQMVTASGSGSSDVMITVEMY